MAQTRIINHLGKWFFWPVGVWLVCARTVTADTDGGSFGHAVIRGAAGGSEIVITTTPRLAGAIHSLTWGGKEFIDSTDHGRQLQSASNFDAGLAPISAETYNPTEAGSVDDGAGPTSSSRLLHMLSGPNYLQSTTQMAFWLPPGGSSSGQPARNHRVLSNHLLTKRVYIGQSRLPHAISYDVTFSLPIGEKHTEAVFEALTGYMPAEFSEFLYYDKTTGHCVPLSDGPGEQSAPVVLSVPGGSHAMGIFVPAPSGSNLIGPRYGRFRLDTAKVVKWNCVFRQTAPDGVLPSDYTFRMLVLVGNLEMVRSAMTQLHANGGVP